MTRIRSYLDTTDSISPPAGMSDITTGLTNGDDGSGMIEKAFRSINLSEPLLRYFIDQMSPSGNQWADPFGALVTVGQRMINSSLIGFGLIGVSHSNAGTAAETVFDALTGKTPAGAAASLAIHSIFTYLAAPVMLGLAALLIPGLIIAYVLPMIPWVMWMAGVAGYLILVCEAIIAVPLWMLAHMTFEGPGLHGRATAGYELIFNVLFRPVLMLMGLFMGYLIFDSMSWLVRMSFGIAAGFVLQMGWIVTNIIGMIVLLAIFVLVHIGIAVQSFRLISLVPHHLPQLIGFGGANRVDIHEFARDAALVGADRTLRHISDSLSPPKSSSQTDGVGPTSTNQIGSQKLLPRPTKAAGKATEHMDSTTAAISDMGPPRDDL